MIPNKKFKQFRDSKNLTQSELAAELSVSQGTITDIERGRIGISKRVLKKINEKYGIETGYFDEPHSDEIAQTNQGGETGSRQGLETSELRKRATNRLKKLMNSKTNNIDPDTLTDEEILHINSQRDGGFILHNLSHDRLLGLNKLFEKQKIIAEKVINSIANDDNNYKSFREDLLAIQSFENVLDNLINCELNDVVKIKDAARHYPNMNFSDFRAALKRDFEAFTPYLKAFSELANAMKTFTDKALSFPEAITGIDIQEFKNYIELNAEIEATVK